MNLIQRRFFLTAALLLSACLTSQSAVLEGHSLELAPTPLSTYSALMPASGSSGPGSQLTAAGTVTSNLGSFNIVIVPDASLNGNAAALAAFNRAAAQWEARISSPITVTINASLAPLDPGIIGSASTVVLEDSYDIIRNQMVAHAAAFEPVDDAIVSFLPTAAQFTATVPSGVTFDGKLLIAKANAKAIGFTGLDGLFGVPDATITFSSTFAFDFDNSDGVTGGMMDFETVAAHEIGHALGFFSSVDEIDAGATLIAPTTLDLFRFLDTMNPTDAATFTTTDRNMVPGANAISDFVLNPWGQPSVEFAMSTGVEDGDGGQASHWKADELTTIYIGMMDPTLNYGTVQQITEADFRALDLIGYNISAIPEPSVYALGALGLASLYWLRRKRVGAGV